MKAIKLLFTLIFVVSINQHTQAQQWNLGGNSGTSPSMDNQSLVSDFLGTRDAKDIVFRRNGYFSGLLAETNTVFGFSPSSNFASIGSNNSLFGSAVGFSLTNNNDNTAFGALSLYRLSSGDRNTAIGLAAGYKNPSGDGNIYIGANSGPETGSPESNKLYIDNKRTDNPVIKGDLLDEIVTFNVDKDANSSVIIKSGVSGINGASGLRLANLTSNNNASQSNGKALSVDSEGDVILVDDATSGGINNIACPGLPDRTNYFTKNADNNGNITCSGVYEDDVLGFVGIQTQNPQNWLEINSFNPGDSGLRFTLMTANNNEGLLSPNGFALSVNNDGDVIKTIDTSIYTSDGTIDTSTISSPTLGLRTVTLGDNNLFFNTNATNDFEKGRIYIGSNTPLVSPAATASPDTDYRLYVEGGILTEKVKIALRSVGGADGINWRDGVFASDYELMPLKEIECFVKENKHLPGIESEAQLAKNGLDIADMQAKQMGKIEELTLYAIEQEKQLEKQAKEIEELKALVKTLIEKK